MAATFAERLRYKNVTGGDYQDILFSRQHNQLFDAQATGIICVSEWKEIRFIILG